MVRYAFISKIHPKQMNREHLLKVPCLLIRRYGGSGRWIFSVADSFLASVLTSFQRIVKARHFLTVPGELAARKSSLLPADEDSINVLIMLYTVFDFVHHHWSESNKQIKPTNKYGDSSNLCKNFLQLMLLEDFHHKIFLDSLVLLGERSLVILQP